MTATEHKTTMASDKEIESIATNAVMRTYLEAALKRKVQHIPEHILPSLTIDDILRGTPQALENSNVPGDIQLSVVLRNRQSIDRFAGRPIKNEKQQDLATTRTIFFYHLDKAFQFQRHHDTTRWNLAFFAALLCDDPATPTSAAYDDSKDIGFHAQSFMIAYLAAVMERHNAPTIFEKREEFVRLWKKSDWDLFTQFASGQKKLLKREMGRLVKEWEVELDNAIQDMGRAEYDRRVAPFVGSVVPGRKDQGLMREQGHLCGSMDGMGSQSSEPADLEVSEERKQELIDALCVPLEQERYGDYEDYDEDMTTPTDLTDAITWIQSTRPAEILPVLMRLFPAPE